MLQVFMAQSLKFLLIPLAMLASVVVLALVFHGMGDSYSKVMYAVWFFPLLLMYLAVAPTYYIYRKLPIHNKTALPLLIGTVTVYLLLFYFVFPVPAKVQHDYLSQLKGLQESNEGFNSINTMLTKKEVCRDGRLNGFEYFLLEKSLNDDVDMLMKKQHSVMFSTDRTNTNAIKICNEDIVK